MATHQATAPLRIASGGNTSGLLSAHWGLNPAKVALDHAASVVIAAPAALTGAVTAEVTHNNSTWTTLQSPAGTDITIGAGKSVVLPRFAAKDLRLKSAGTEAADRDFFVTIQEDMS